MAQDLQNFQMVLTLTIENQIHILRWVDSDEDHTGWWYFEEDIPWFVGATAPVAMKRLLEEQG